VILSPLGVGGSKNRVFSPAGFRGQGGCLVTLVFWFSAFDFFLLQLFISKGGN